MSLRAGINIMSYYMPAVLISAVGLSNELARLLTAVNSLTYLIFSCVSVTLVERWGRRGLMLLSTAGQGLAFLVITILLRYGGPGGNRRASEGSIVFFFLYFMAFGLGMLGVPWLYPTEINSIAMRTKGAAVATATNWYNKFSIVLFKLTNIVQDDELCDCPNHTNRNPRSRMEVLDCVHSLERGVPAYHLPLLS